MKTRKLFIGLWILLMISVNSIAQSYSAFDQARILKNSNIKNLEYYVNNGQEFNTASIKANLTTVQAQALFKRISKAYNLLDARSPEDKFNLIIKDGLDINDAIKLQFVDSLFNKALPPTSIRNAPVAQQLVVSLTQPTLSTAETQGAGITTAASPAGANFTTNLLTATASLLIERGKQELASSFYRSLQYKLDSVLALNTLFPNTTEIFVNRDPFSLPSMGATWKSSFELDLRSLPENLVKFLEVKLPEYDNELEVILGLVQMLEDIKSGQHLYEAIDQLYYNLDSANKIAQPIRLISLMSKEMTTVDADGTLRWATLKEFRSLGPGGQAIFIGLMFKEIEKENFTFGQLSTGQLNKVLIDVSNLLNALNIGSEAIEAISGSSTDADRIAQFNTVATSVVSTVNALNKLLGDVTVKTTALHQVPNLSFATLTSELTKVSDMLDIVSEGEKAVNANEYGRLVPLALQMFSLVDTKSYNDLKAKLDTAKKNIVVDLKEIDSKGLVGLISFFENANFNQSKFGFASSTTPQGVNNFVRIMKDSISSYMDTEVNSRKRQMAYDAIATTLNDLKLDIPERLISITTFIIDVTQAKSADEIQSVVNAAILPVGSYRMKRQPGTRSIFLQGYAGFIAGYEFLSSNSVNQNFDGFHAGLFLPVGLEYTVATKKGAYNGIFLSVIDVGALGSFGLSDENSDLQIPSITFQNVLSPGLFYTHGFKNAPITLGVGARYAPQLREISVADGSAMADLNGESLNAIQGNIFLAVDIPLARIFNRQ